MIGTTRKGVSLMNTKTMTTLLRVVLLAAAVLCGIFFLWFLPSYGQEVQQADPNSPGPTGPASSGRGCSPCPSSGPCSPAGASSAASAPRRGPSPGVECTGYAEHLPSGLCRCADLSGGDVRAGLYGGRQRSTDHYHHPHGHLRCAAVGIVCYVLSRLIGDAAALREENDMTI